MLFSKLPLLAVAASGVLASPGPAPTAALAARDDMDNCASAAVKHSAMVTGIPTPNEAVEKILAKVTISDGCKIPAVTGDKANEYTAYFSDLSSWHQKFKTEYAEVVSACSKDIGAIFSSAKVQNPLAGATACDKLEFPAATEKPQSAGGVVSQAAPTVAVLALAALAAFGLV